MSWISVEDRLPEIGDDVLIYAYRYVKEPECLVGCFQSNDIFDLDDDIVHLSQVTHWQPLPEPPK